MTAYNWTTTYAKAVTLFGDTCGAALENDILQTFTDQPVRVDNEIESIGRLMQRGQGIYSPWLLLKSRLNKAPEDITATDTTERERKIAAAKTWIRNAGVYYDRETELLDELFPPHAGGFNIHSSLTPWDTTALRDELAELWWQQRPRGERAEAEHLAYMAKVKADRERLAQAKRDHLTALNEAQPALNSERQQATA